MKQSVFSINENTIKNGVELYFQMNSEMLCISLFRSLITFRFNCFRKGLVASGKVIINMFEVRKPHAQFTFLGTVLFTSAYNS